MYIVGMKTFYYFPIEGQNKFGKQYQIIANILKSSGLEIVQNIPKKIHAEERYASHIDAIHEADVCILECSHQGLMAGLLITKALELEKPVIVLYHIGSVPKSLFGITSEKFQLIKYTQSTAQNIIRTALEKASLLADKRFNFFVSSSMLAYLNTISRTLGITKSTFIRNLIEDYKKKYD